MAKQHNHLEYRNLGDTGEDTVSSLQALVDGEAASMTVLRRPTENLRSRTELIRDSVDQLFYYRDHQKYWIDTGASPLAWDSATGRLTNPTALTILPLWGVTTSTKGVLNVGTSGVNRVVYSIATGKYATDGANKINIEHRDTPGSTLAVTISDGPVKYVLVTMDSTNAAHNSAAVTTAVQTAVAGDAILSTMLVVTNDGLVANAVDALVPTFMEGTVDAEAHTISAAALTAFTTTNPVPDGATVGLWYEDLIEEGTNAADPKGAFAGGRAESSLDRGNAVADNNLFVSTSEPEKLAGCVLIGRRIGTYFILADGRRIATGSDSETLVADNITVTAGDLNSHITNTSNPHGVTASQAGAIPFPTTPATVGQHLAWNGLTYEPVSVTASTLKAIITAAGADNGQSIPINVGLNAIQLRGPGVGTLPLNIDTQAAVDEFQAALRLQGGHIDIRSPADTTGSAKSTLMVGVMTGAPSAGTWRMHLANTPPYASHTPTNKGDLLADQDSGSLWYASDDTANTDWLPVSSPFARLLYASEQDITLSNGVGAESITGSTAVGTFTLEARGFTRLGLVPAATASFFQYTGPTLPFKVVAQLAYASDGAGVAGGSWSVIHNAAFLRSQSLEASDSAGAWSAASTAHVVTLTSGDVVGITVTNTSGAGHVRDVLLTIEPF